MFCRQGFCDVRNRERRGREEKEKIEKKEGDGRERSGTRSLLRPIRYKVIIEDPYSEEERFKAAPKRSKNIWPSTSSDEQPPTPPTKKKAPSSFRIPSRAGQYDYPNHVRETYSPARPPVREKDSSGKMIERLFDSDEEDASARFVARIQRIRKSKRTKSFKSYRDVKPKRGHPFALKRRISEPLSARKLPALAEERFRERTLTTGKRFKQTVFYAEGNKPRRERL